MLNDFVSLCTDDCSTDLLYPAIEADQDCTGYNLYDSQVSDLYIKPLAAATSPFTWASGETIVGVSAQIDNTLADNTKSHWLVGEGGVDVPEKTVVPVAKNKDITKKRTYTLTMEFKNMSLLMYEHLRAMQCGSLNFTFWYGDVAGFLYGKTGGISPTFVDVDFPKDNTREGINRAIVTLRWEAKSDPERKLNPFA